MRALESAYSGEEKNKHAKLVYQAIKVVLELILGYVVGYHENHQWH